MSSVALQSLQSKRNRTKVKRALQLYYFTSLPLWGEVSKVPEVAVEVSTAFLPSHRPTAATAGRFGGAYAAPPHTLLAAPVALLREAVRVLKERVDGAGRAGGEVAPPGGLLRGVVLTPLMGQDENGGRTIAAHTTRTGGSSGTF